MRLPAITELARRLDERLDRRLTGVALVGLLAFVAGYLGQGSWGVGTATSSAAGAIVTDVVGGAGTRTPVPATVSLAVTNVGLERVRVLGTEANGLGTVVQNLTPPDLELDPGMIGRFDADVTLDCKLSKPLRMPDVRLELPNGKLRRIPVSGSGMLLEACSRAAPSVRPLVAALSTPTPTPTQPTHLLTVQLSSPTGRQVEVRNIRAGGVALRISPPTVTITGRAPVDVQLTAPQGCPVQWLVAGVPTVLTVDLRPASAPGPRPTSSQEPVSDAEFGSTVQLRLGPALASWLLAACSAAS
ncbi:MAG TPA: hypothetical protein VLL08_21125 [Kineosporiaceae bacterium]|nr:hypothetical protein [Kineosporiaceae bacterium]